MAMNTNRGLWYKVLRAKYRKYAFRISAVVHIILFISVPLFLIQTEPQVLEDEIQVELIKEVPQRVVKIEPAPIPKKEIPEPKIEMPKKRDVQKQVKVIQPERSMEIAKMSAAAPKQIDIDESATEEIDVDAPPLLETPDLSTDADLASTPASVLSSLPLNTGNTPGKDYGRREGTGVRSSRKGTGIGKGGKIKRTGTGTADGLGKIGDGIGDGSSLFGNTIKNLAEDIIEKSGGAPIDVVFVVDTSGSMEDNIKAVPQHLGQMIDVYEASESDYALGLTLFTTHQTGNDIEVHQLTTNVDYIKQPLYAIKAGGGENLLDAIDQTVEKMRFRKNTIKHLILVSDEERLRSLQGLTASSVIARCQSNQIHVNVLGVNNQDHKRLARETGGTWHAVPQDTIAQKTPTPISNPYTTQTISKTILQDAASMPIDVILFIDSSKSMEDKVAYITQQIDWWIRDWDNAFIDYRIGVVRFRAQQTVNIVNVFKPPQTQEQIHKILRLPCQDDENLLHAVVEGERRLKRRPNVKTHFILITDEPGNPKAPIAGTIGLLKELPVVVSVIGATDPFQQQVASATGGVFVRMPNASHSTPYE